jgi:hypothetical protein
MTKSIVKILTILLFFSLSFNFVLAADNLSNTFGDSLKNTAGKGAGYDTAKNNPMSIISTVIKTALSFLGVIFLILMIYGGYLWMTASGNEQQVEKAKGMIKNALIGLIIVIAAYALSYFVISKLGATTLKQ